MKTFLIALLFCGSAFAAAKSYQVTGTVLDVKDDTIIVDKKGEKFEIGWPASTKVNGAVKKGDKVTVYYTMSAVEAEIKGEAKKADATTDAMAKPETKKKKK
jgi:Holliday junction resolvasome RuvABC DNA-binding subunit